MTPVVRAAGGVPTRDGPLGAEVLVIHRLRYGDWTFPKGKREDGETDEECAVREVAEETGLLCQLEQELGVTSYADSRGRPKSVRYWRMRVVGGALVPRAGEVDEVRWVPLHDAPTLLTYSRDVTLLRGLEQAPAPGER